MGQRQFIKDRDFQSPLGNSSLFHNVYVDIESNTYPNDETPPEDKYTYTVIAFDSGVDVFKALKDDAYSPKARHMYIFVEKDTQSTNNFFGTVCRVKMGTAWKSLAEQLKYKQKKASVNDDTNLARNLNELAEDIVYHSRHKYKQLTKKVLLDALQLEISNVANYEGVFKDLLSLNNKLADWIYKGAESIESWKFTEENYEFKRTNYNRDIKPYKPIIPVPFEVVKQDFSDTETKVAYDKLNKVSELFNDIEGAILLNPLTLSAILPANPLLVAGGSGTILIAKAILEENLPDDVKSVFNKIKVLVTKAKDFLSTVVKEKINQNVTLLNAFLCGLLNGLLSLLQFVVMLIGFAIDNIPFLELEKTFTKEAINERAKKLEFVEDILEVITNNVTELFNGFVKTLLTLPRELFKFVQSLWRKFRNVSQYFLAFLIGAIVFEVIVELALAFFTGGTANVAKVISNFTRVTTKAAQKGIKIAKNTGKAISKKVVDIYDLLKKEFLELVEAVKEGKFIEWLENKLDDIFDLVKTKGGTKGLRKSQLDLSKQLSQILNKVKPIIQNVDNLDDLYVAAKEANKELVEKTKELAVKFGGKPEYRPQNINNGLKSKERALEKINADYKGNPALLVDVAGSKIVYNTVDGLYDALEKIIDSNVIEIIRFKDRIAKPLASGYRDILMNAKMSNGHIVEFRLHLKRMDYADKIQGGHKLYQQRRTLEAISESRNLTKSEIKKMIKLIEREKKIYEKAWDRSYKNN